MTQAGIILAFLIAAGVAGVGVAYDMGRRERKRMARRMALVADSTQEAKRRQSTPHSWRRLDQFDGSVRRIFGLGIARRWAMTANTPVLSASAIGIGTAAWFLARHVIGLSPLLALLSAAASSVMAPRFILQRQQQRAETAFTEAFPDAVDSITRMLQAGMPIASALGAVASEAMPPVNGVFKNIADQTSMGISISDALDASSKYIGLPDFRFFAVAVVLQSSTGGNLVETLEKLSEIIRKRRAVRNKAQAVTAEVRFAAYILGALPFLTIGALLVVQPDYLDVLFADPRGHMIIGIAAGLLFLAALSIRTMMSSVSNV
jgi:tight adherence protein B